MSSIALNFACLLIIVGGLNGLKVRIRLSDFRQLGGAIIEVNIDRGFLDVAGR